MPTRPQIAFALFTLTLFVCFILLPLIEGLTPGKWARPSPLINPLQVSSINNGAITLTDDRTLIPAGITPKDNINSETFDEFLRIATAQGLIIQEQLDNNLALITIEPKFYNSCGTSRRRWAGYYTVCDLSQLAIRTNYAIHDSSQKNFSPYRRWKLEHTNLLSNDDQLISIDSQQSAFRSFGFRAELEYFDDYIKFLSQTPGPD